MIKQYKKKWISFYNSNELLIKIISIVIISILSVSTIISLTILKISEKAYINSYNKSNEIILKQVRSEYENLNDNITSMLNSINQNTEVINYFTNTSSDPKLINKFLLNFRKEIDLTNIIYKDIPSNLIIIGTNGNTFYQNNRRVFSTDELLKLKLIQKATESVGNIHIQFLKKGLTSNTENESVIAIVKALYNEKNNIFGYAIISITERDFSSYYSNLVDSDINTILIENEEHNIVSSNKKNKLGEKTDFYNYQDNSKEKIPNLSLTISSLINKEELAKEVVILPIFLLIVIGSIALISTVAFFTIRRTTQPIYLLTKSLPKITKGDFSQKIPVQGSNETKELARVYNSMLEDLNDFVSQLIEIENQKRMTEIHALQMQIQPHFIYNTLTSIKFLIWQGEQENAISAMDAFIRLLRHTISEVQEFITLEEELLSVKDYILILQIRFGSNINVTIHQNDVSLSTLIPKMILQPIIENTFLHAFPKGLSGNVHIFIKQNDHFLIFDIIDNGIGMSETNIKLLKRKFNNENNNNFSGVGIKNIDKRLKLIYGADCGIKITSTKDLGTTIKLTLKNIPKNYHNES